MGATEEDNDGLLARVQGHAREAEASATRAAKSAQDSATSADVATESQKAAATTFDSLRRHHGEASASLTKLADQAGAAAGAADEAAGRAEEAAKKAMAERRKTEDSIKADESARMQERADYQAQVAKEKRREAEAADEAAQVADQLAREAAAAVGSAHAPVEQKRAVPSDVDLERRCAELVKLDAGVEELDQKASGELQKIVEEYANAASDAEIDQVIARIRTRRGMLPLESGEATEIVGLCKQTLVFGFALFAILPPLLGERYDALGLAWKKTILLAAIFGFELCVLSLVTLFVHVWQSAFRYPFLYLTRSGNAWPYFYYAALGADTPRTPINRPRFRLAGARSYVRDLLKVATRTVYESRIETLRNELQQYFLLLSYMGYAHQFALRLSRVYLAGLIGVGLATVIVAVTSFTS